MSNRFGRDTSRNSLFSTYDTRSTSPSKSKSRPSHNNSPYGSYNPTNASNTNSYGLHTPSPNPDPYSSYRGSPSHSPAGFSAYPGAGNGGLGSGLGNPNGDAGSFRSATPNSRGQYSTAVLDELESQNDDQVGVLSGKVRELKNLTTLIGTEIRDSSALAEKMNDQFENSRLKIKGTMRRMLRMAEKTGVGWRVWLGFFAAVIFLFWYVWLF